ncbi:MAG TPA: glycosyltransferase [Burkholderiales bacterium]|nr:glycosyltransferase [Burkholderiales bacterium]
MKFAVTVVSPPGYVHSAVFAEVAETIHHGLRSLGHDCVLTTEGALPGRQHIVLGSNLLPHYPLPLHDDAILYNLEQVEAGSSWLRPELVDILRRYTVWDYNPLNAAKLEALGVKVARIVPVGYVDELTRIERAPAQDIDVLFFGSMNQRRADILDRMDAAGLRVNAVAGMYGKERDALIGRAKLLLNVHYYEAKVLEIVRISYLLANRCAVLSERSADPAEDRALGEGVAFADYDELAQRARELINAPAERERMARRGFEIMSARRAADYLRAALAPA